MPKMKPHSGMKKRVKITGTGKLRRQKANRRHNFEYKPIDPHPTSRRHHRGLQGRHQPRQEDARPLTTA